MFHNIMIDGYKDAASSRRVCTYNPQNAALAGGAHIMQWNAACHRRGLHCA